MTPPVFDNAPTLSTEIAGSATLDDLFHAIGIMTEQYNARVAAIWMSKRRAVAFGSVGFIAAALPPIVVTDEMPLDQIGIQGWDQVSGADTFLLLHL